MGLFSKQKKEAIQDESLIKDSNTNVSKEKRKYFEVFGDTLKELDFFKTLSICLTALSIFLLITLKSAMKKPPLVIRVDQIGQAQAIQDVKSSLKVSAPEISNYTRYFLQYFTAWNFHTFDDDFEKAFKMMTPECQQRMNGYLTNNHITEDIKRDQIKVKLNIKEITIEKDTAQAVILKVKGARQISSYEKPELQKEVIFEDSLVLKKIDRTMEMPWGLVVDNWTESLFK